MRLHGLLCGIGVALSNRVGDLLVLGITLAQALNRSLPGRAEVQSRIPADLPQQRVEIGSEAVTGCGCDGVVKIEVGACTLLFSQGGGGPLNASDINGRGTHRRHAGKRGLKNGAQLSDFDGVGATHQCTGTAPQSARGGCGAQLAALAQLCKRTPQLMTRD